MADQEFGEQLGSAWALHRQGHNESAIREFSSLLQVSNDNIDALYGIALAQRSAGELEEAKTTFARCLVQIDEALKANPGEDRYEMLKKMVTQRLAELKGGASGSQ